MRLCEESVTVINSCMDDDGLDAYFPTVIRGVSWFADLASAVDGKGLKIADKVTVRIPEDADFGGREYVGPAQYAEADKEAAWTLRTGDLIVPEALEGGEVLTRKLLEKRGAKVILGVTDNRRAPNAPHWKVVCG